MAVDPGVVALSIPIVAILAGSAVKIAKMFAPQNVAGDLAAKVDGLEQEIITLRQELSEAHERLDFAERLLAKPADPKAP